MAILPYPKRRNEIVYPDSDGKPMAENTLQFQWIVLLKENLELVFVNRDDVFVAGDLLWYPVEGEPTICQAPDTMVVFGRPKGYRGSYKQWEEEDIPPQVVFEVMSPNNRVNEMNRKFGFYERHGVDEYYVYDPDRLELFGWIRIDGELKEIANMNGWVSPRLGIRFDMTEEGLVVTGPDGRRFQSFVETAVQRDQAEQVKEQALRATKQATLEKQQAEQAKQQAEQAKQQAEQARQHAEQAQQQAELEKNHALQEAERATQALEKMRAKLKALGQDPDS